MSPNKKKDRFRSFFHSVPLASAGEEFGYVGRVAAAPQACDDVALHLGFVKEEEASLVGLVARRGSHVDGFHRRGVDAGVVHFGAERHGRRRKILYLLQAVAHAFHLQRQLRHVLQTAAGVAADEIGYQLVPQPRLLAYLVEASFRLLEEAERRLAHQRQHRVRRMLRRHLQPPASVMQHHRPKVLPPGISGSSGISVSSGKQIAPDPAAHIQVLHLGMRAHLAQQRYHRAVVAVQVLAHRGHRAAVAAALTAEVGILALHPPHVRRRPAEVRQHAVELRVLGDEVHLIEDRLLAARGYLLALVGADGAERAAAEAAAVRVHAPAYHLEGRYRPAFLVFGVRQPHVRQVEAGVDLLRRHRRLRRVHHHQAVAVPLHQRRALYLVALPLDDLVVLRLRPLAPLALLKGVQFY